MRFFAIALLLVSMTSCSDGQQQTERQIREVLSWSATADMVLEARARMLVPNRFAALTVERCAKEIDSLAKALPASSPNLGSIAGRLTAVIGAAHDDIVNGRTDTVSRHLEDLRSIEAEMKAGSGAKQ